MFEKPSSDKKMSRGFMLNKIGALKPDDIQNFRTSLEDPEQYIFDGQSEDDQAVIVALNNLSDDEFDQIVQNQKSLMGVHDLNNYLTLMYTITLNPRYQKFNNETK